MGQFYGIPSSPRVMFDEESDNGLVLCDKYLPVEVLIEIFCRADCKTLLNCQLVCKRWNMLMKYVWHKKTEQTLARPFPRKNLPWDVYYTTCMKKPYERNLLRNHSGAEGIDHWELICNGGNCWIVEEPPVGIPELPQTELFQDRQICFATSFQTCSKLQNIVLLKEGISSLILDRYQPPIEVSEWYGCRWDCPAEYEMAVTLIDSTGGVMDTFGFKDIIVGEKQNKWLKCSHVFENYGIGLRGIVFQHSGEDRAFWKGHYGSKMTRASICVKSPDPNERKGKL